MLKDEKLLSISPVELVTIDEAAYFCSVDRRTIERWLKDGKIRKYLTVGGRPRVDKRELTPRLGPQSATAI